MNNKVKLAAMTAAVASAAALVLAGCGSSKSGTGSASSPITLRVMQNVVTTGAGSSGATWMMKDVIPAFEAAEKAKGVNVKVNFQGNPDQNASYQTKEILALKSGTAPDVFDLDQMLTGQFAQAGYIKPLFEIAPAAKTWSGWSQMPESVQNQYKYNGQIYGVPSGTDGRVLYYNKDLFQKAGLPTTWNPKSWAEVISAGQALSKVSGITPIQINAGTAMAEATTMQGLLPLLAGAGSNVYTNGKWTGDTKALRDALGLYQTVYVNDKLGNPTWQKDVDGRNESLQAFADNKVGILLEGNWGWQGVWSPKGTNPMANRDSAVGMTLIPAETPGSAINGKGSGQDFTSFGGGGGFVINPKSKNVSVAWDFLAFMNSNDMLMKNEALSPFISAMTNINSQALSSDKGGLWIAQNAVPLNLYRPAVPEWNQVTVLLQQATLDVVNGKSPADAAATYAKALEGIVGSGNVVNN